MNNLSAICDLPIEFDVLENKFSLPNPILCQTKRSISIENLANTLLNKFITYPKHVYNEYCVCLEADESIFEEHLKYDLMVIPFGLLGIEFIKSETFFTPAYDDSQLKFSTVVECIQGKITVLMQKNSRSISPLTNTPNVQECIAIDLDPRDKIAIPQNYLYTFVNTGEQTAILSRVHKPQETLNQEYVYKSGMAYYCIRKNAKLEFVYNPKFRHAPALKRHTPEQNHLPELGLNLNESLYNLVKSRTEFFLDILL